MIIKDVYGLISVLCSVGGSVNYIRTIVIGKTKPHAFTWGIWAFIFGIVFVAQWGKGAGPGAWTAAATGLVCLAIFVLALFKGEKSISPSDWVALLAALAIIPFWHFTHDALLAVIFATLIDVCAYYPTIRKSWIRPQEENVFVFAFDDVKWVFGLMAMQDFSMTTLLSPLFSMVANTSVAIMIVWRRAHLKRQENR